jgi:hypothetical protein
MRLLEVKDDTSVDALSGDLLDARISDEHAQAALASLRTLNPHADLAKLKAGTILVIPESPGFKVSATDAVLDEVLGPFEKMVKGALEAAAAKIKAGNESRAAERGELAKALKTAAFKRVLEGDPDLKQQVASATEAMNKERAEGELAEQTLDDASKGTLAALKSLRTRRTA